MVATLTVVIVALAALTGILINWFKRPPAVTTRRLVVMLAVVVMAGSALALWRDSYSNNSELESTPGPSKLSPTSTSIGQRPETRSLESWVSDINTTCAPVNASVGEERSRYERSKAAGSSVEEDIETMRNLRSLIGPLMRDLNRVELPSDRQDMDKANDWLQAYSDWYRKLLTLIERLDGATSGGLFEEVIDLPGVRGAYNDAMEAIANVKGKGDMLGIECPASNVTK